MLARIYEKLASPKIAVIFGVLYLINQAIIYSILSRLGPDALKLQLTLSSQVFAEILAKWGDAGLKIYLSHFYFDFHHVILYSVCLASSIAVLTHRKGQAPSSFALFAFVLPFAAAKLDVLENTLHLIMIFHRAYLTPALVAVSGIATNVKWLLAFVSVLIVLYYSVKNVWMRFEK
ncbi:MAG: hypothetical protein NT009_03620 [Proteobacteria bacterium]|nr:hypothetical protein [Pseudomonadota bacterium]